VVVFLTKYVILPKWAMTRRRKIHGFKFQSE